MVSVITAICVVAALAAGVWFSPLRVPLVQILVGFHRYKFACRIQLQTRESDSVLDEKLLCVQMIGRIPIPEDNTDTSVQVEITDITESRLHPAAVLSVDERYRNGDKADFDFTVHNGVIPNQQTVIYPWKTVVQIPADQLRFARRGRRKLLFRVSVLSCENDDLLVCDQQSIEYIFCRDGYMQLQERKLDVLKASINLAGALSGDESSEDGRSNPVFIKWLNQKAKLFPAAAELVEWASSPEASDPDTIQQSLECLLAYAEQADKLEAIELTLQVFALADQMTIAQFSALQDTADQLNINRQRFLALCQKRLLFSDCRLQDPAVLLGIGDVSDEQTVRCRLNEEYRKWNARVTHPDEAIRRQADRILSLIADLRSRRIVSSHSHT
jgi:hypothetical protein